MDAAWDVLREKGNQARVEDVTARAGTAKGTFYLYFPTWDDLLLAMRTKVGRDYGEEVGARLAADSGNDAWAFIESEGTHFVDFLVELHGLHEAVFHGPIADVAPGPDEPSAYDLIAALITLGIEHGAVRPVDVHALSRIVFHALHGLADAVLRGEDRDRLVTTFFSTLRDGIGADANAGRARS